MPHIHDLADEILLHILSRHHFDKPSTDLKNVALTSRRLYPLALVQFYRSITLPPRYEYHSPAGDIGHLIERFTRFPERARWVESVSFGWLSDEPVVAESINALFQILPNVRTLEWLGSRSSRFVRTKGLTNLEALVASTEASSLRNITVLDRKLLVQDFLALFSLPRVEYIYAAGWDSYNPDHSITVSSEVMPRGTGLRSLLVAHCSSPSEPLSHLLLEGHTKLKELVWRCDEAKIRARLSPKKTMEIIGYLANTLVKLRLEAGHGVLPNDSSHLDLNTFTALEVLEIDDRFLFKSLPSPEDPDPTALHARPTDDLNLYTRLPPSLKNLEIWFDVGEWAFRASAIAKIDCKWIEELAKHKASHFPNLSRLKVVEWEKKSNRFGPGAVRIPRLDMTGDFPPRDVVELFEKGGVNELELRARTVYYG